MALYNFDGTLFDGLALPDQLDRDIMISTILIETSNMSVIDPSFPIMKESIRVWSQSKLRAWQKQANVLYENYDPFVNIKRDEVRTIIQDRDLKGTNTGKVSVKAWDATDMTDRQSNDISSTDTGKITTTETYHLEGDSAITDAQDVAIKEVKLRAEYEMYNIILQDFKKKFCIQVY
jgi:hypothetical protein